MHSFMESNYQAFLSILDFHEMSLYFKDNYLTYQNTRKQLESHPGHLPAK